MSGGMEQNLSTLDDTISFSTPSERLKLISKARALSAAAARLQKRQNGASSKRTVQPQSNEDASSLINYKFGEISSSSPIYHVKSTSRLPSREIEAVIVPTSIPLRPLTVKVAQPSSVFEKNKDDDYSKSISRVTPRPGTVAVISSALNTRDKPVFEPLIETKHSLVSSLVKPFSSISKTIGNISNAQTIVEPSNDVIRDSKLAKSREKTSEVTDEQVERKSDGVGSLSDSRANGETPLPYTSGMIVSVLSLHAPSIPSARRNHQTTDFGDSFVCSSQTSAHKQANQGLQSEKGPPIRRTSPDHAIIKKRNAQYTSKVGKQTIGSAEPGYFARRPLQETCDNIFNLPENIDNDALHEAYLQFAKIHEDAENSAKQDEQREEMPTNSGRMPQAKSQNLTSLSSGNEMKLAIKEKSASEDSENKREPFPFPNELVTYNEPVLIANQSTIKENQKWQARRQGTKSSVLPALWVPVQNTPQVPDKPIAVIRPMDDFEEAPRSAPFRGASASLTYTEHGVKVNYGSDLETNISARRAVEPPKLVELSSAIRSSTGSKGSHRSMTQEVMFEEIQPKSSLDSINENYANHVNVSEALQLSNKKQYMGSGGGDGFFIGDEQTVFSSPMQAEEEKTAAIEFKPMSESMGRSQEHTTTIRPQSPFPYDLFASTNLPSKPSVIAQRPITSDPALVLGKLTELYALPRTAKYQARRTPGSTRVLARPLTTVGIVASQVNQELSSVGAMLGHSIQKQLLLGDVNIPQNLLERGSANGSRPKSQPMPMPQSLRPSFLPAVGKSGPSTQLGGSDETLHVLDDRSWLLKNAAGLAAQSQHHKMRTGGEASNKKTLNSKKRPMEVKNPEIDVSGVTLKGRDDPFAHIPAFEALKTAVQETVRLCNVSGSSGSGQESSANIMRYPSESASSMGGLGEGNMGIIDDSNQSDMSGVNRILKGLDPKVAATLRHGHGGLSNASPRAVNAAVEAVTLQAGRLRLWKQSTSSWRQKRSAKSFSMTHSIGKACRLNLPHHKQGVSSKLKTSLVPEPGGFDEKQDNNEWDESGDVETEELSGPELERQIAILKQKIGLRGLNLST